MNPGVYVYLMKKEWVWVYDISKLIPGAARPLGALGSASKYYGIYRVRSLRSDLFSYLVRLGNDERQSQ